MRKLLVPLILALVVIPAAWAGAAAPADGSLSVSDGRGKVVLVVKGAIIGRFGRGTLSVEELNDDGAQPVVRGYERVRWSGGDPRYSGRNIRFRLIGGRYRLALQARGIQLSVVGRGSVLLDGAGSIERNVLFDGVFSLNGEPEQSLPDDPTWFKLAAPPPPPPA